MRARRSGYAIAFPIPGAILCLSYCDFYIFIANTVGFRVLGISKTRKINLIDITRKVAPRNAIREFIYPIR